MSPIKRGRPPRKIKVIEPEPMPPKRRKTAAEIQPEENKSEDNVIPVWLRTSIQILLINFYPDGAVLHSMQKEYENCFKDKKVFPKEYGFRDWEEMLRDPQFKNHFIIYMDKKIPRLKGYALPRGTSIIMKDGLWEIDPKIADPEEKCDASQSETQAQSETQSTTVAQSKGTGYRIPKLSTSKTSTEIATTITDKDSDKEDTNNNGSKSVEEIAQSETVKIVDLSIKDKPSKITVSKQKPIYEKPTENDETPKNNLSAVKQNILVEDPRINHRNSFINPLVDGEKLSTEKNLAVNDTHENDVQKENLFEIGKNLKHIPFRILANTFGTIGGSGVAGSTKSSDILVNFSLSQPVLPTPFPVIPEKSALPNYMPAKLTSSQPLLKTPFSNALEKSPSLVLPMPVNVRSSQSDPPPRIQLQPNFFEFFRRNNVPPTWTTVLEEENIVQPNISNPFVPVPFDNGNLIIDETAKDQLEQEPDTQCVTQDSATSPEAISSTRSQLSPQNDWSKDITKYKSTGICENPFKIKAFENGVNSELSSFNVSELSSSNAKPMNASIRRISDCTDISCTENSDDLNNSPKVIEEDQEDQIKNTTEIMEWHFKKLEVEIDHPTHISNLQKLIEEGKIQNPGRDPRLIIGSRGKYISVPEPDPEDEFTSINLADPESIFEKPRPDDWSECASQASVEIISIVHTQESQFPYLKDQKQNVGIKNESRTGWLQTSTLDETSRNLTVTITNHQHGTRNIPPTISDRHQEEIIPQDNFDLSSLNFCDMWKSVVWKNRCNPQKSDPNIFFKTKIYDQWRSFVHKELRTNCGEFKSELQKYEEKPYPSRCSYFLRSSLRMVEIDYRTNNQFSNPRKETGVNLVEPDEVLFYVDFAGAPGGVIEFYDRMRRLSCKGFGVTYQKRRYDLHSIPEIVPEFFESYYGKLNSFNGDGSLFCSETVDTFIGRIMEATNDKGVHIVTTIGAVARVVYEETNDEKWQYQFLAQIMVALIVLREGGHMAFKMFELKSPFSVGLLYILYRSFKCVQVTRLNIFAPCSGERAIICLWKKSTDEISEIVRFLQECHKILSDWYIKDRNYKKRTFQEIIPMAELEKHEMFMDFVRNSNERLKRNQLAEFETCTKNLRKLGCIFSKAQYRSLVARTTELWNVPPRPRQYGLTPITRNPDIAFQDLRVYPEDTCKAVEQCLNEYNLYSIFSPTRQNDWRFFPVGCRRSRGFYMGVDGLPYYYHSNTQAWIQVRNHEFRLPNKTLVYGEILPIYAENYKVSEEVFAILDGFILAGKHIDDLPYHRRRKECENFAISCTKVFFPRMTRLVVTKGFDFMKIPSVLKMTLESPFPIPGEEIGSVEGEKRCVLRTESVLLPSCCSNSKNRWIIPSGLLFFGTANNGNHDFCTSVSNRVYWQWVQGMDLPLSMPAELKQEHSDLLEDPRPIGTVSATELVNFVNSYS